MAVTQQGRPEAPSLYENYPVEPIAPPRQHRVADGAKRGAVTGMAAGALTILVILPPRFGPDVGIVGVPVLLVLYMVIAAIVAAAPGAAVGGILSALARAGATRLPIRLLGGLGALTSAALVSATLPVLDWPGAVMVTLCGAYAAPWVAWGPDRPTLV